MITKLLVAAGALAVVAVAVDRVGVVAVSSVAAHRAATRSGAHDAHVNIHGVPFLTQVADGRLAHVTVTEHGIVGDGLTIETLHADARGVHLAASDVARGRVQAVPIEHVTGTAVISYASLTTGALKQLGINRGVTLALTPRDAGDLTAEVSGILGLHLSFAVPVPTVSGGRLQLGGLAQRLAPLLPDEAAQVLAIPLPSLPYGLQLSSATAEADGVHFAVTGSDVTLRH